LRTLVELDADGKRIAVLGEMKELGSASELAHREVGETAATFRIDQLITIGDMAEGIAQGARAGGLEKTSAVRSTREAAELLGEIAQPGDLILVKGSRSARTEQVIEAFGRRHSSLVISP
jgi:UDP-N-acetylmuramoyl-tripeptide--D-alanyl-D-alanine ligase